MNHTNHQITLTDKRKLGYSEFGNSDGYPIIYFHGSQSSRLEMHYDMSFSISNSLRIITVDRPGHGMSDFNSKGSILSFAKDVKQLTEHLGIYTFSVAGMSAGAPFALGISYLFPENVYKAAIISGFAPFNKQSEKYLSKEVKIMLQLANKFPFLLKVLLKIQVKQLNKSPKKALKNFLKIMGPSDQIILKNQSVMQVIESMFKEAFRNGSQGVAYEISNLLVKPWNFELNQIKVPVTFWQGKKDNNIPFEWSELMCCEIKNAKLKQFPEEGHLIIFEHVEEIFKDLRNGSVISTKINNMLKHVSL